MPVSTGYPHGPGTMDVSSNEPGVFVWDEFLNDPLRVSNAINAVPAGFFLGETLLTRMPNPTGVVLYNQLTDLDLYVDVDPNLQPGVVAPTSEYPEVGFTESGLGVTETQNRGAKFYISDKEKRRDRRDLLAMRVRRFANTLRKIHNDRVINAILGDPYVLANCQVAASGLWSTATTKGVSDLRGVAWDIDAGNDLAYKTSWVLAHPDAVEALFNSDQVQNFSPREARDLNPLFRRELTGLAGIDNWIIHRGMTRNKVVVGSGTDCGFLAVTRDQFVKTEREEERERTKVWGGREEEPVINQPLAIRVITGVL